MRERVMKMRTPYGEEDQKTSSPYTPLHTHNLGKEERSAADRRAKPTTPTVHARMPEENFTVSQVEMSRTGSAPSLQLHY